MSYSTVIAEINTILSSATNVGTKIYNYDRLETNEASFKSAFKDTTAGYIKAWSITRTRVEAIPEASYTNQVSTTWTIRGYFSFKTGANNIEATMQGIIDNVRDKFREKPRLNSIVLTCSPIQVDIIEPQVYAGVLIHYIEMRLITQEEETWT